MHELKINLNKIRHNFATVQKILGDVNVVFVSKCLRSDEGFLRALKPWEMGVCTIADSEITHLARLDLLAGEFNLSRMLLRPAAPAFARQIVAHAEIAACSQMSYAQALSREAQRAKKQLKIMLMCDLGDLREGYFSAKSLLAAVRKISALPGLKIHSIATNLTCLNGVLPSEENLSRLVRLKRDAEGICGYEIHASGGNSSSMGLARAKRLVAGISELRLGDALLFGKDCSDASTISGCFNDAFSLKARVIECKRKPSMPLGERALDAFGREVAVRDEGLMRRVILDIGKASMDESAVQFAGKFRALRLLGASSDHLVACADEFERASGQRVKIGDEVKLILGYASVLRAYASDVISVKFV